MLPIELLREIGSHWPARNGLARTCRQLAYDNPGPSTYANVVIVTHNDDTLARTILPDGTLHGAATITSPRNTETLTIQYDLGQLISGVRTLEDNVVHMFETTNFVGNPYLSQQCTTNGAIFTMGMGDDGVLWIRMSRLGVQFGVSTSRDPFVVHTFGGTFDGSTLDDVRTWYRENEQKLLDELGALGLVGATHPYILVTGGPRSALARITKTLGHDPLPGVRAL